MFPSSSKYLRLIQEEKWKIVYFYRESEEKAFQHLVEIMKEKKSFFNLLKDKGIKMCLVNANKRL